MLIAQTGYNRTRELKDYRQYYLYLPKYIKSLYSILNLVVGPLSVYVCALNRT